MRRRQSDILEEPTVNLTPLIDVVFVVLIMFIVMAPLLELDRIELAAGPPLKQQPEQVDQTLVIHVLADNTIRVNAHPVSLERLEQVLVHAKQQHPHAHPQLFHDRKATFGTYQSIKNAVEAAGFSELDVLLKPN